MRQIVSTTVSPGGFGKTTLALHEALTMVAEGLNVWVISGEDAKEEIDRRIAAHCQFHQINLASLPGRLFADDRLTFPLVIAGAPRPGQITFNDDALGQFETAISADHIDAVILDPWVSFHTVPESDNGAIDAVIKRLGVIAYRTNCSIQTGHHVRKPVSGQTAITVDDARGASALINACRSARVINRMSKSEAGQAHVDDDQRAAYIRLDNGKTDMRPASSVSWFHLINVEIANGDHIQAPASWNFPDLFRGVSVEDTDWVRELKTYRADSRSPDWLGFEIARRMNLNAHDKGDCIRINKMLGVWLAARG